jgi:hypothetical protein
MDVILIKKYVEVNNYSPIGMFVLTARRTRWTGVPFMVSRPRGGLKGMPTCSKEGVVRVLLHDHSYERPLFALSVQAAGNADHIRMHSASAQGAGIVHAPPSAV